VIVVLGVALVSGVWAGTLNPPAAPAPSMKSLQQIWDEVQALKADLDDGVTTAQAGQETVAAMLANLARAQGAAVSNVWQTSAIAAAGSVGQHNSLAFTPGGQPAVSYRDSASNDLLYAEFDGSAWNVQAVDSASDVRDFTSLAFTAAGRPAIAYYDHTAYDLKYAEYNGTSWSIQTVDSADTVGQYAALAFTPDGRPAISYYDVGNADLKYAEWNGGAWVKTVVDGASSTVGTYTSLAFTQAGRPAISYFGGNPNLDLKYAEYNGTSWALATVDSEGNTGFYTSLAFTPAGRPAISYYDNTNVRVLYTEYTGSAWVRSVVQAGTSTGFCTSLAFTSGGRPAIAYTDFPNRDVIYAEFDGAQWNLRMVDSAGEVGLYVSLAFSPAGRPAISYFDDSNDDLKFASVVADSVSPQSTGVQAQLAAVSNQVAATQGQVSGVQNQVTVMSDHVTITEGQVTTVVSRVSGLQSQIAGVSNQILDVKSLLVAVDSKVGSLTNQLSGLEQRLLAAIQLIESGSYFGGVMPAGMALIPAGSFVMGDAFGEGDTNEVPLHAVAVSAFLMSATEVTKAQWDEVASWAAANGYDLAAEDGLGRAANHPVHSVSWYECVKWCNAKSEKEGRPVCYTVGGEVYRTNDVAPACDMMAKGYRLPTEAEWEKAARGGAANRRFPWSDTSTIQHTRANYYSYAANAYDTSVTRFWHPTYFEESATCSSPAGAFAANGYGLYDMSGNILEWCWDWYGSTYYGMSPAADPSGPASGSLRILRGGSWWVDSTRARVAHRNINFAPGEENAQTGFRAVLPLGQH
jgi:formylglycine-generating enzyme required for sulfatase activity